MWPWLCAWGWRLSRGYSSYRRGRSGGRSGRRASHPVGIQCGLWRHAVLWLSGVGRCVSGVGLPVRGWGATAVVLASVGLDEWGTGYRMVWGVPMVGCTTILGVALVFYYGHGVV